jgi:hypothetical protein
LLQPGTAEVRSDGTLIFAASDLDHAHLAGHCSLRVNARDNTLAVRHGNDHLLQKSTGGCPGAAVFAQRELRAIGVSIPAGCATAARVIRRSIDGTRWLELRFPPEAMKEKTLKNKAKTH